METCKFSASIPDTCQIIDDPKCINGANTAWMLIAIGMVFLQTPGLGLTQAGLIRRKNSLSMLMQTMMGTIIGSLLWWFIGYTLTFGPDQGGFIGGLEHTFYMNVPIHGCLSVAPDIPGVVFATFQMMFGLMVPVIITGAWAERFPFISSLWFFVLWPIFVYYPLAHWVWGGGWLGNLGVIDFAGGITIHTNAGVASLVVAKMLHKRKHFFEVMDSHHNIPLTIVGGTLIWFGWYGFNGASGLAADGLAAQALLNTHLGACVSGITWVLISYHSDHHFHLTEVMNGAFAGLAGVTPGSGFMHGWAAVVTALIVGVSTYYSSRYLKGRVHLDDVLDVSSLQGVAGIVGSLCAGLFATQEVNPGGPNGAFYGGGELLGFQIVGVLMAIIWSGFWTFAIMKGLEATVGIHVAEDLEEMGLDAQEIGDAAYMEDIEQSVTAINESAASGDVKTMESLWKAGVNVDNCDYDGRSPLHLAASQGHLQVVKFLVEVVEADVNRTDRWGGTALADAKRYNHSAVVEYLAEKTTIQEDHERVPVSILCEAAFRGDLEQLKDYHQGGANLQLGDYDGRTPLHLAASQGSLECVKFLVETCHANPRFTDRWGSTPLADAKKYGHTDVTDFLAPLTHKEMPEMLVIDGVHVELQSKIDDHHHVPQGSLHPVAPHHRKKRGKFTTGFDDLEEE